MTPLEKLSHDLEKKVNGDVRFDIITRKIYSVDASIIEIEPLGVVIPNSSADLIEAVKIAKRHQIPIIPRGAATGITGGCLGKGVIFDLSKYINSLLEINIEKEYVICEPGVVQDRLNEALAPFGYRLGPDTSTGNRATLGGMLANNSAGGRSLRYGKMSDQVLGVDLLLATGETIWFEEIDDEEWKIKRSLNNTEGHIYREIYRIKQKYHHDIKEHFPRIPRNVSGYNLDELVKNQPLNVAKLIAGSEGTFGIATKIKMHISKLPKFTGICLIHIQDLLKGLTRINEILEWNPLSLEMIDSKIIEMAKQSPIASSKLSWLRDKPEAVFIAEFDAEDTNQLNDKLQKFKNFCIDREIGYGHTILTLGDEINDIKEVRKSGLGLLLSKRTFQRAIAFIEDLSVAPENLASFIEKLVKYLKSKGKEAGIYGHIGSGCMHIRPYIDLRDEDDYKLIETIMIDISELVKEHGGSLTGEHGDGLIRSWLIEKMFGKALYQAFIELKTAFDPDNLMNPGKIVHGTLPFANLRLTPNIQPRKIETFLDFSKEGGFELAADLCNGNGQCRKKEGVMCPSFQATDDEYTTTRARAQTLRAIINGRLPADALTSEGVLDVLDLCLECKGCKTECPSQVDMAKMKAEVLYQHNEKYGYSLRSRLFANIGFLNKLSSPLASLFNWMSHKDFVKYLLEKVGISPNRNLPKLASKRFSRWFAEQNHPSNNRRRVVLFNDTFTEFNQPEIGKAAVKLLQKLEYEVILPAWSCCGRPMISKGFLKEAKEAAGQLVNKLYSYAVQGIPIVGLEPSCLLTIKDDFAGLLGQDNHEVNTIIANSYTIDEFLANHIEGGKFPLELKKQVSNLRIHGHCYQKALVGMQPTMNILKSIPGIQATLIQSGCCGMAGSFGYEKEHYELSMKIGELKLFPAVRTLEKNTEIIANGFSCRTQIKQGTDINAKHLVEWLSELI